MTVSTDKKHGPDRDPGKIDRLLTRRVAEVVVADSLKKKLLSGRRLRVKLGVDPTAPDLHIGHAVPLKKLREFQDMGHQVVLIIGDYTARVGDPTGKSKTRPMLTEADVKRNAETYLAQAGKVLDVKKLEIRWNGEWFSKMDFNSVIALAAQFTVARMIERDDFSNRLKEGTDVHLHELMYPMMQAYDSIMVEADVEIGGTDQKFNILAGRDLQRKMGKPEQDCMFLGPILVGTDGVKKMSKSLGNYVGVSEAPEEMFGKIMSIPDAAMRDWFLLATDMPEDGIRDLLGACAAGKMNPRDAKVRLAKEIIAMYHSARAADAAEERFKAVFQKKEVPDDVPECAVAGGKRGLAELLVETKLVASKSEARRQIEQGGVKVGGEVVNDAAATVVVGKKPTLIQKGKRHFVNVVAK
jgi:tyrosyl-tRNA synthetase